MKTVPGAFATPSETSFDGENNTHPNRNMTSAATARGGQNPDGDDTGNLLPDTFRPGKFPDVFKFVDVPQDERSSRLDYVVGSYSNLAPGSIFHISEKRTSEGGSTESRIDKRVMLALRTSKASVMCLTLCMHPHSSPASPKDHWSVCGEGAAGQKSRQEPEDMPALELVLKPFGPKACAPCPDTTINIRDIWNVELEVPVATLGYVKLGPLRKLVEQVQKHFVLSLDEAVPPPASDRRSTHAPAVAEAVGESREDAEDKSPRQRRAERKASDGKREDEENRRKGKEALHGRRKSEAKVKEGLPSSSTRKASRQRAQV